MKIYSAPQSHKCNPTIYCHNKIRFLDVNQSVFMTLIENTIFSRAHAFGISWKCFDWCPSKPYFDVTANGKISHVIGKHINQLTALLRACLFLNLLAKTFGFPPLC